MIATAIALVVLLLGAVVLVALRSAGEEPAQQGSGSAAEACDLTSKAAEATRVGSDARYAAAVLLLDKAIIASARAAHDNEAYMDLDHAVQAVHTAGHRGDPGEWRTTLDAALEACRDARLSPRGSG